MRPFIVSLKSDSLGVWNSASVLLPANGTSYTLAQQAEKEAEVDRLMAEVEASAGMHPGPAGHRRKKHFLEVRGRIQKSIIQLLHSFECEVDETMQVSFSSVTDDFIERAYDFDSEIGDEAVYQAARNVMIMNTFQKYLGKEVRLTPSVFAYSMLYPYTDNYLDSAHIDVQRKREANERLLLRLDGISIQAQNRHEQIIDSLVGMIENEFERAEYPQVYDSLLAIHQAQIQSVSQSKGVVLTPEDLLDISVEKGGTSVLADGYLAAGDLTENDALFIFRFGVLLQLIDDLQDLQEDYRAGQQTLAGLAARCGSLGSFTNQLLSYLSIVFGKHPDGQRTERQKLHTLIARSCRLLIYEAIALNRDLYSDRYLQVVEQRSPVRLGYLKNVRERLQAEYAPDRMPQYDHTRRSKVLSRKRILELIRG